ncbi:CvpA family protein [Candidatus Falkowbacteria bacterium]|nr:CvpA family protein [Candidatus Falkowbacteria bacterium]
MPLFDLILVIILGGFVMFGFWFGFIHTLGSLLGIVAGAFVAGHYYQGLASWGSFIWGGGDLGYVIAFMIILIFVNRIVGLLFYVVDRIFEFLTIIPFLKTIDRLAGALLGFLEGAFTLGLVLFFLSRYPVNEWLSGQLVASTIAPWLVGMAQVLAPLLPEILRQLQGVI